MKRFFTFLFSTLVLFSFIAPISLHAEETDNLNSYERLVNVSDWSGYDTSDGTDVRNTAMIVIQSVLGLLAIIFIIMIIIAGIKLMISGGDEQEITEAKHTIRTAIIGLIITISAGSITIFVVSKIKDSTKDCTGFNNTKCRPDVNDNALPWK